MSNTTLADGYRWLRTGETMEPGDEYFGGGLWFTTSRIGQTVANPGVYRRKIAEPTLGSILKSTRPPLGLIPRNIWIANRKVELVGAIQRYLDAKFVVPTAWLEELIELTNPK